ILTSRGEEFSVRRKGGAGDDPIVAAERGNLIALGLAPEITPLEAPQILFAGLRAQSRQNAARLTKIATLQRLRHEAHVAGIEIQPHPLRVFLGSLELLRLRDRVPLGSLPFAVNVERSEERRVGKEWRARW